VAAFTAARFAPLLTGPLGGIVADRTDRPRVLRGSIAAALAIGVAVAALASFGEIAYWQVVVAGLLIGTMQAPLQPVRFTLIMDLVGGTWSPAPTRSTWPRCSGAGSSPRRSRDG